MRSPRRASSINASIATNAPPGEYRVTFLPVPYYETPASQTNSVVGLGTTVFSGQYAIVDVNNNGMADNWEEQYFGNVSPTRTEFTDTDLDGLTDNEEFMAGTSPTNSASILRFFTPAVQNGSVLQSGATTQQRFGGRVGPGEKSSLGIHGSLMTRMAMSFNPVSTDHRQRRGVCAGRRPIVLDQQSFDRAAEL